MGVENEILNGGEIVAKVLQEQKVKFLFTLCGGHISPILVGSKNLGIRVVDTRHEANAVFAADAVSRTSGVTGVAAVTAGPGITNAITAMQNALQAQSPLVLMGGAAATLLKGMGSLQDIDQMGVMKPNVKWAASIQKKKDIYPTLQKAFRKAKEGVPGPVFVEFPVDLLYDEALVRDWYTKGTSDKATIKGKLTAWYISRHLKKMFAGADGFISSKPIEESFSISTSQVMQLQKAIGAATKPVLLIGSGAMMQPQKANDLASAVSQIGVPVYLSGMARGLLGKDHTLQYRHKRKDALKAADLVILAGVPCDFRLNYGKHIGSAKFVSINRSKRDLTNNRKPDLAFETDPCEFLLALSDGEKSGKISQWKPWKDELTQREKLRNEEIKKQAVPKGEGINPVLLFQHVNSQLPKESILIADGGDFVGTSSYVLEPRSPLSWLDPGVFGTLGVGGGFAMGAKLCNPNSETYIIYGDGSSAFSLMEMDSLTRHKLPVIAIIGNDASWNQIARDQIEILKDACGTVLAESDYHEIAHAFGAKGKKVKTIEEFDKALLEAKEAVKEGHSFVINAILAKSDFRKGSMSM